MQYGVTFPQNDIGNHPEDIKTYAQEVEAMGYSALLAYDHVLGAGLDTRPNWIGPYNSETDFHEIFVLFGYLAALTQQLRLVTGVVILPQRQTALVAKQAAEVDILSGGRLRLGIGVGWNDIEYQGLNEDFSNRGIRSEEQIAVMRALWSATKISFNGRWHTIDNAGIKPLPVQRPIPIWIGGYNEATLKRIGRIGDGWIVFRPPTDETRDAILRAREYAQAAGRQPDTIGIETQISLSREPEANWQPYIDGWRKLGAQTLYVNTMGMGFTHVDQHLEALRRFIASANAEG